MEFVRKISNDITSTFKDEVESGLIEIISPPAGLYPDAASLKQTIDDPMERVRWRSKQNFGNVKVEFLWNHWK